MSESVKVFLSFKYHDINGNVTEDYYMAKDLYNKITALGINTFFSDASIVQMGESDYKQLIDKHLDEAEILIVVSTSPMNCNSNWVRYEWDSFYNDILSERKKGELISYLDTDDIGEFPRTIRTLQVFEKHTDGINDILIFLKNYFGLPATENDNISKGSSYNYNCSYELGDERKRLAIQAKVESSMDTKFLSELFDEKDDKKFVLDVGCSMGSVTFDIFEKLKIRCQVLGVDKFTECVEGFNKASPSSDYCAEILDFEDVDWENKLQNHMEKNNVKSFDLVYCSLSLHHMSDSATVLKKIWKYIKKNGFIYVRTCDDALKIAYPNSDKITEIIKRTAAVPNVSDRFHGRKIYNYLYRAKFKNISIKTFLVDTGEKDLEERYALYYSAFVWRKNYFKSELDNAKTPEQIQKAMKDYNEIIELLDEIESCFTDKSFYFGYYVTIAIGQKNEFML